MPKEVERVRGKRRLVKDVVTEKIQGKSKVMNTSECVSSSKTRRWGTERKHKSVSNKFSNVAHAFFFFMLSGFAKSKDDDSVWDNTGHVLTYFISLLTTFVECSGNGPSTKLLAIELFQFVYSFHMAEHEHIRQVVLYAFTVSIHFLPHEFLYRFCENNALVDFLLLSASQDPSETCRNLAKAAASTLKDSLNLLQSAG